MQHKCISFATYANNSLSLCHLYKLIPCCKEIHFLDTAITGLCRFFTSCIFKRRVFLSCHISITPAHTSYIYYCHKAMGYWNDRDWLKPCCLYMCLAQISHWMRTMPNPSICLILPASPLFITFLEVSCKKSLTAQETLSSAGLTNEKSLTLSVICTAALFSDQFGSLMYSD